MYSAGKPNQETTVMLTWTRQSWERAECRWDILAGNVRKEILQNFVLIFGHHCKNKASDPYLLCVNFHQMCLIVNISPIRKWPFWFQWYKLKIWLVLISIRCHVNSHVWTALTDHSFYKYIFFITPVNHNFVIFFKYMTK